MDGICSDFFDRIVADKPCLHRNLLHCRSRLFDGSCKLFRRSRRTPQFVDCAKEGRRGILLRCWVDRMVSGGRRPFCSLEVHRNRYLTFHLLLKDSLVELPLGDTSRYFGKSRKTE
jgi:hypothetical protein